MSTFKKTFKNKYLSKEGWGQYIDDVIILAESPASEQYFQNFDEAYKKLIEMLDRYDEEDAYYSMFSNILIDSQVKKTIYHGSPEELDEFLDMLACGGMDPNPPRVHFDYLGLKEYAKSVGKEISELSYEETDRFITPIED